MATNTIIDAKTLVREGLVSLLKDGAIGMDKLEDYEIQLLVEKYGHGWPELLGLV